MKALILSRQGEEILEELKVNPAKTLTFRKIVFSNLSQPDDVPLSGNRMYGTLSLIHISEPTRPY